MKPTSVPLPENASKRERKQRDQLNRFHKLVPGLQRVYDLENLTARLEGDLDVLQFDTEEDRAQAEADVLFLKRLAWDLYEMRRAVYPNQRHNSRYDIDNWPRGPRP